MELSDITLYKYFDGGIAPLESERCLFRNELDGVYRIVENDSVLVARLCDHFASLTDHSQVVASIIGHQERPASFWKDILAHAAENGILISRDDIERTARLALSDRHPRRKFGAIAIPTRNRPKLLGRLVASLAANLCAFSREVDVVIMDDSELEETQHQNLRVLAPFVRNPNMHILYGNRQSRQQVARRISKRYGLPERTIEFGLLGYPEHRRSVGASRNAILAERAGDCILYMDDDVQCRSVAIPGASDRTFLGSPSHLSATWLFPSTEGLEMATYVDEDFLGLHERAINVMAEARENGISFAVDISYLDLPLLRRMLHEDCHVVITQIGIAGDCASDSLLPYLFAKPENLEQLLASPECYLQALRSRLLLRGTRGWLIASHLDCMSYCMGVDNSALLPPFSPVLRGQEVVFTTLIRACVAGSLFGVVPRAILHDPGEIRSMPGLGLNGLAMSDGRRKAEPLRLPANVMLSNIIGNLQITKSLSPSVALNTAGRQLHDLSRLSGEEFSRAIRPVNAAAITSYIQYLDATAQAGGPELWLHDVRAMRDSCLRLLNSCDQSVPFDIEQASGPKHAEAEFQKLVLDFAELAQTWPDIVRSVKDLRAQEGLSVTAELEVMLR